MIFVPAQWWHMVVNLEDSVAITQNYVSRQNLPEVSMLSVSCVCVDFSVFWWLILGLSVATVHEGYL